ncbi:uncharacterized protein FMAN_03856 [Fusarium mangiferae]|uniref:Uncharacterized protein n=1 Tax=Fusarium mangiferae TaxID=192010 RepID=A0A1L7UEM6_FUSMA|nr:uncharacterized protein FMAN_03856 [Fusarium mangiferae]CVL06157.1 uncharacterized protein FMAN_03856 [Fusarium mangiferae]
MVDIESHTPVKATDRLLSVPNYPLASPINTSSDSIPLNRLPTGSSLSRENLVDSMSKPRRFAIPYQNKLQIISVAVHVLAIAITIVIVQFRLREIYWFDQTAKLDVLGMEIRAESNTSALQFAAKIHEALIQASLTAMAFHIIRHMLRGQGVSFGVLDGVYRFGSVPWLWSKGLWGALHRPSQYQNFLFAIGLAMAAIYANVIAPSSAILLTPTLDWWKVHDAFNGQNFTTLITGNSSRVFPSYLTPRGKCEDDPSWDQCPGGGYSTLLSLLRAYQTDGIDLETQIKLPVSKSYRKISSTLDFNNYTAANESLAVATTSHTSIAMIAGLLWNHIREQKVGRVNDIERPQFRPSIQDIRAPLVQVQCSPFSWINATKKIQDPIFKVNNLRNFSQLVDKEDTDNYQRMGNRIAKPKDWLHTESTLHIPTLRWVDASSLFDNPKLSLAAVATVPAYYLQGDKAKLDSIILPCMIDARWVDVSLEYDPTMDNTIHSNFTDLMSLRRYWDPTNTSSPPGGLTSPNVVIDTSWARSLNLKTRYHYNVKNGKRGVTAIENLMDTFIKTGDDHDEDDDDYIPNHFVPPFNTATGRKLGNFTTDGSKVESYINEISKTVSAILSLAIVDGMSRNAISLKMRLITKNLQNGLSQGIEEFWEPHPDEDGNPGSEVFEATEVDEPVSIDWEVYRYGWGYGRQSTAVYFAITALFIHVALVLVFGVYIAMFWVSGERPGKSRDTISEFVALALASPLTGDNASEVRRLANGEEEENEGSKLLTLPIKLGMNDENERILLT